MATINISLPDEVHKRLKVKAAIEEKTLKSLILESLAHHVTQKGGKIQ